jgi:Ner family transcriptional regulator
MLPREVSTNPRRRNEWIKYALHSRRLTLAKIGADLKLKHGVAKSVLRKRYPRVERAIADALGERPEHIWPERYSKTARRAA